MLSRSVFAVGYASLRPPAPTFLSFASVGEGPFSRFSPFWVSRAPLAIISGMEPILSKAAENESEESGFSTVKISRDTRAELARLSDRLKPVNSDALIRFLIRHYDDATHLNSFFDLRELCALADRLHTVLLFLATTNLELGQHLRRTEAGHYRRLIQYGDELVALYNRMTADSSARR